MTDFTVTVNGQPVVVKGAPSQEEAQRFAMKSAGTQPDSKATEEGKAAGEEDGFAAHANNIVRQIAKGASFGGADMLAAGLDAGTHGLLGRGSDAPDLSSRFAENLAKERGQTTGFQEKNPHAAMAANIVGNILGAGAAVNAGLPLAGTGPGIIGNTIKTGAGGAALGGAQGFLEGHGGLEGRANNALPQAIGGAAAGAAMPWLGLGGSLAMETGPGRAASNWMGKNVTGPIREALGASPSTMAEAGGDVAAESAARERLATALQRSRMNPEEVQGALDKLGPEGMLADTSDPALRMTRGASTLEGETRGLAQKVLEEGRDTRTGSRIASDFRGNEPPPSGYVLTGEGKAFDKYAGSIGDEAYGKMRAAGLNESPEMEELQKRNAVAEALQHVKGQAEHYGEELQPIDEMHRVKRALNTIADSKFASGTPVDKDLAGKVADKWESALWDANPEAHAADQAFARAKSLPRFYDAGHNLLTQGTTEKAVQNSAPALADILQGADPLQRVTARAGATNAAVETALKNTSSARGVARNVAQGDPVEGLQAKITELYGPEWADKIVGGARRENVFANTSNQLLRGSQTADKQAEAGLPIPKIGLGEHGLMGRLMEYPKALVERLEDRPNEAVRNEIGKMMLNPDAEANRKALLLAAELMKRRAAPNDLAAGLSSGIGSAATRSE